MPRTTVLRISNIEFNGSKTKLRPIFESCGKVACIAKRNRSMADVHFKLEEWPNMLKIINK